VSFQRDAMAPSAHKYARTARQGEGTLASPQGNQSGTKSAYHSVNRCSLPVLFAACAFGQQPNFTSGVSIIEVDAQVTGKNGTIESLRLDDFAVKDNRRPVTLRYCSQDETSLDIIFVFELSRFMAAQIAQIRTAAEIAMSELREGDRVAVMSFNKASRMELPLTGDLKAVKPKIRSGLLNAVFEKDPAILAAADASAKYLLTQPQHGHRVVLVFTGDVGLHPVDADSMAVTNNLWDANATLSAVVIPNAAARFLRFDSLDIVQLKRFLHLSFDDFVEDVAEKTGGEVVFTGNMPRIPATPNPNAALRQAIQRMRRQYRLYYDRPAGKPGQHHRVDIELSPSARSAHPDARMIARKGYVIPKGDPQ
jgi:VWFA-related protein